MGASSSGRRRIRRRSGFNLTEISLAMLIMAMAMIPVFGLVTGGVVRTDVSIGYETASQLASSILNTILSTTVTFQSLLDTAPASVGNEHPGPTQPPDLLGPDGTGTDRYIRVGRIRYYTDMWIGFYPITGAQEIKFRYFLNPQVFFEKNPSYVQDFYTKPGLGTFDYSPFNPSISTDRLMASTSPPRWATTEREDRAADLGPTLAQQHLAKVVLRMRWGEEDFKGSGGVRGAQKSISFVTMKARLE